MLAVCSPLPCCSFDDVIRNVAERAKSDSFWNQLRAEIVSIDQLSKKKGNANTMDRTTGNTAYAVGSWVGRLLGNYNTIEALLIFDAAMVCLLGVLYTTVRPVDEYYSASRHSITINLMLLIIVGIVYFVCVFVADLTVQFNQKRLAAADAASQAARKLTTRMKQQRRTSHHKVTGVDILKDAPAITEASTTTNPLFLKGNGTGLNDESLAEMVGKLVDLPPLDLWTIIREHYAQLATTVGDLTTQLNLQRAENQKMADVIRDLGAADMLLSGGGGGGAARLPARADKPRQVVRRAFEPQRGGDGIDSPFDSPNPMAARMRARSTSTTKDSPPGDRARSTSKEGPGFAGAASGGGATDSRSQALATFRRVARPLAKRAPGGATATAVIVDGVDEEDKE